MKGDTKAALLSLFAMFLTTSSPGGVLSVAKFMGVGILYGFGEYILHSTSHTTGYETIQHRFHHVDPKDRKRTAFSDFLFFKLSLFMTLGTVVLHVIPLDLAVYLVVWYGMYEVFHMLLHDEHETSMLIRRARVYHNVHHDNTTKNYSVTTTGWDRLFRTADPRVKELWGPWVLALFPYLAFLVGGSALEPPYRPYHLSATETPSLATRTDNVLSRESGSAAETEPMLPSGNGNGF